MNHSRAKTLEHFATETAAVLHVKGISKRKARALALAHIADVERAHRQGLPPHSAASRILSEERRGQHGRSRRDPKAQKWLGKSYITEKGEHFIVTAVHPDPGRESQIEMVYPDRQTRSFHTTSEFEYLIRTHSIRPTKAARDPRRLMRKRARDPQLLAMVPSGCYEKAYDVIELDPMSGEERSTFARNLPEHEARRLAKPSRDPGKKLPPGWYVQTPAGLAGPYKSAYDARQNSMGFPVVRRDPNPFAKSCGCAHKRAVRERRLAKRYARRDASLHRKPYGMETYVRRVARALDSKGLPGNILVGGRSGDRYYPSMIASAFRHSIPSSAMAERIYHQEIAPDTEPMSAPATRPRAHRDPPKGGRRYEIRAWSPNPRARKRKGEIHVKSFWFWTDDPHYAAVELLRLTEEQRIKGAYGTARFRYEVIDHGTGGKTKLGTVVSYDELLRRAGSYVPTTAHDPEKKCRVCGGGVYYGEHYAGCPKALSAKHRPSKAGYGVFQHSSGPQGGFVVRTMDRLLDPYHTMKPVRVFKREADAQRHANKLTFGDRT